MSVDVVITTMGRPELRQAVESVFLQTERPTKVVVVVDDPAMHESVEKMVGGHVEVLRTTGRIGGGAARNLGTRACSSTYVAYLDDDDVWIPNKLELQTSAADASGAPLVTCKAFLVSGDSARVVPQGPFPTRAEEVLSYMLLRPGLRYGWGVVQTSCLLVRRENARAVGWHDSLPKHQDWDFVARMCEASRKPPAFVDVPLVRISQGTSGSISKRNSWDTSLAWIESYWDRVSPAARGDFIATQVLRAALAGGDWSGVWRSVVLLTRSPPHAAALVVGVSGAMTYVKQHLGG